MHTTPRNGTTPTGMQRPAGRHVLEMLKGRRLAGLTVTAQAYRVRADETDEVSIVVHRRDHWVGARHAGRFTIWACVDREAAELKLDELTPGQDGWTRARIGSLRPDVAAL